LENWAWDFCERVWEGEGWPEVWKKGVIVPVVKKGEGGRVEDYRGVTLMPTLYKVYMEVLAERIREEVEGKGMVPHNQTGFRKGMGTMDNVYVVNYLVNRQLGKRGGKVVALFVDVRAAFDSVDRGILGRAMRERGIREGLVERAMEMWGETKSRVRVRDELGGNFWTARRQGCPLSPILFNMMLADLEEEMGKVKWGGVRLGKGWVYTLAYADNLVLLAEGEDEIGKRRFGKDWGRRLWLFDRLVWTILGYGVEI